MEQGAVLSCPSAGIRIRNSHSGSCFRSVMRSPVHDTANEMQRSCSIVSRHFHLIIVSDFSLHNKRSVEIPGFLSIQQHLCGLLFAQNKKQPGHLNVRVVFVALFSARGQRSLSRCAAVSSNKRHDHAIYFTVLRTPLPWGLAHFAAESRDQTRRLAPSPSRLSPSNS